MPRERPRGFWRPRSLRVRGPPCNVASHVTAKPSYAWVWFVVLVLAVGLRFLAVAGLAGHVEGDALGPITWVLALLLLVGGVIAVRHFRMAREDRALADALATESAAALPRIVGATCPVCVRRLAMERGASHCATCASPVHDACMARHQKDAHSAAAYR